MLRLRRQNTLIPTLLLGSLLAAGDLLATPYQLQYGGRLTSANGSPIQGPINLSLGFFSTSSGGTALQSKNFSNVSLQDGVFSLSVNLTPSEYAQVFAASDVWIEVQDLTKSKIYPRQHLSAAPYAFRIPTDGITLSFDSNGQLSVKGLAGSALPTTTPTAGQVIKWGNSGWEWGTDATSAPASIDSTAITDGSILDVDVATNAGIAQSKVAGLVTALSGKEPTIANGVTSHYWRGDKSWATLDTSAVPESGNLYYTDARARGAISANAPLVYNSGQISLPQASSASSGYLSSNDWLTFNSKQSALAAGTSTDYLRGDKTWAPLSTSVVSEGSNLYYSDARARAAFGVLAPLSYNSSTGAYSLGVASSVANGYLSSNDWVIFNNKQAAIGSGTSLSLGTISTSLQDAVTINPFAAASGQTGELRFGELAANGTNYIGFKAPDQIAGNFIWTLPETDGTNGQSLTTDGAGNLVWTTLNAGSSGGVTSITAGTGLTGGSITSSGTIGLANTSVTPGTYSRANITVDAQGRLTAAGSSAAIVDADIANTAAIAQSKIQNLSSDLNTLNAALSGKEGAITAGTTAQYYRGDKSWQALNTTAVAEATNLYYTDARSRAAVSASGPLVYSSATGQFSMPSATNLASGYLSSTDWVTFNNKQATLSAATSASNGYLTSSDWISFNTKSSSQWSTSGSNISYVTGNVGIGTTSPTKALDVLGTVRATNFASINTINSSETFGNGAIVGGFNTATAIGYNANASGHGSTALGSGSTANSNFCTAIGAGAQATWQGIAIGNSANNPGIQSIAIGNSASVGSVWGALSLGFSASATQNGAMALGYGTVANTANTLVAGSNDYPVNTVYFGKGISNALPTAYTIAATGASGTDTVGGDIKIAGGSSTGTGTGGNIILQTSSASATSGTLSNALAERMRVTSSGNVGIGTTSPSTALDVAGQIRSQVYNAAAGTSFDWNNGNIQYTSATCGSFSFSNMKEGGVYTLIVKSTTSNTCVFSQTGLTVRAQSALTTASGSYTIFNFIVAGGDVFVKIQRGF